MDKHTLLERTKMSNNFFKAIEKYKLDPFTKEVIASRLFKVSYGVGGGEDVEDLAPYAP